MKIRPVLPLLLVALALWVTWCSGVQHGAVTQKARDADAQAEAVRDSTARYEAAFAQRDSARRDTLARLITVNNQARGEIARLKQQVPPPVTQGDSVRDSVIAAQAAFIVQQDSSFAAERRLYRAMIADRDTLLGRKDREIAALERARDEWRRAARPSVFQKLAKGIPFAIAGAVVWEIARE